MRTTNKGAKILSVMLSFLMVFSCMSVGVLPLPKADAAVTNYNGDMTYVINWTKLSDDKYAITVNPKYAYGDHTLSGSAVDQIRNWADFWGMDFYDNSGLLNVYFSGFCSIDGDFDGFNVHLTNYYTHTGSAGDVDDLARVKLEGGTWKLAKPDEVLGSGLEARSGALVKNGEICAFAKNFNPFGDTFSGTGAEQWEYSSIADNAAKGTQFDYTGVIPFVQNRFTSIGKSAFADSNIRLDGIHLENCVIEKEAFKNVDCGDEITLINCTVKENAFEGVKCNTVNLIGCNLSKEVFMSSDVKTVNLTNAYIPMHAFKDCAQLDSLNFSDSAEGVSVNHTQIECEAFYGCTALETLDISDVVTFVAVDAFKNCTGIKTLTVGDGMTYMPEAFSGDINIENITVSDNMVRANKSSQLVNTKWFSNQPDGVVYLNKIAYAYKGKCADGENIVLRSGTISVSNGFMAGSARPREYETNFGTFNDIYRKADDRYILSDYMPYDSDASRSYGSNGKYAMSYLPLCPDESQNTFSITFPAGLKYIGNSAFADSNLSSDSVLTIPDSVEYIAPFAFCHCPGLQCELDLGGGVNEIGFAAFADCSFIGNLIIPDSVETIKYKAFANDAESVKTTEISGNVKTVTTDFVNLYENRNNFTSVTLGSNIVHLQDYAFYNLENVEEIAIAGNSFAETHSYENVRSFHYDYTLSTPKKFTLYKAFMGVGRNSDLLKNLEEGPATYLSSYDAYTSKDLYVTGEDGNLYLIACRLDKTVRATCAEDGYVRHLYTYGHIDDVDARERYCNDDGFIFEYGVSPSAHCYVDENGQLRFDSLDQYRIDTDTKYEEFAFVDRDIISAGNMAHTPGAAVVENRVTDGEFYGSYDRVVYCSVCDAELSREHIFNKTPIAYGQCGDNAYWILSDQGELVIYGYGPMWDFNDEKPTYSPYTNDIKSIDVLKNITRIGDYAFCEYSNLATVELRGNSIESVGKYAFYEDEHLTTFPISKITESAEDYSFYGCMNLYEDSAYYYKATGFKMKNIGDYAFNGCTSLYSLQFYNPVEAIGNYAFSGCDLQAGIWFGEVAKQTNGHLTQVGVSALKSIGDYAFLYGIRNLPENTGDFVVDLSVPSLEYIGSYAFAYNYGLGALMLPTEYEFSTREASLEIGDHAFFNCENANRNTIQFPFDHDNEKVTIGECAFHGFAKNSPQMRAAYRYGGEGRFEAFYTTTEKWSLPATCVSTGTLCNSVCCADCGEEILLEYEDIPIDPDAHRMGEWYIYTAATDTANGIKRCDCLNGCGYYETKEYTVIKIGDTKTLIIPANEEGYTLSDLEFFSCDENIATVDTDGNITGVDIGSTDLILNSKNSSDCLVLEVDVNNGYITGIDAPDEIYVLVNDEYQFVPSVLPAGAPESTFSYRAIDAFDEDARHMSITNNVLTCTELENFVVRITADATLDTSVYEEPVTKDVIVHFVEDVDDIYLGKQFESVTKAMVLDTNGLVLCDSLGNPATFSDDDIVLGKEYYITNDQLGDFFYTCLEPSDIHSDRYDTSKCDCEKVLYCKTEADDHGDYEEAIILFKDGHLYYYLDIAPEDYLGLIGYGMNASMFAAHPQVEEKIYGANWITDFSITENAVILADTDGNPIYYEANPFVPGDYTVSLGGTATVTYSETLPENARHTYDHVFTGPVLMVDRDVIGYENGYVIYSTEIDEDGFSLPGYIEATVPATLRTSTEGYIDAQTMITPFDAYYTDLSVSVANNNIAYYNATTETIVGNTEGTTAVTVSYKNVYGVTKEKTYPIEVYICSHSNIKTITTNITNPTCTEEGGYDEVLCCTDCGKVYSSTHYTTEALGHIPSEPKMENIVPATATEEGSYDLVVRCERCDAILSSEHYTYSANSVVTNIGLGDFIDNFHFEKLDGADGEFFAVDEDGNKLVFSELPFEVGKTYVFPVENGNALGTRILTGSEPGCALFEFTFDADDTTLASYGMVNPLGAGYAMVDYSNLTSYIFGLTNDGYLKAIVQDGSGPVTYTEFDADIYNLYNKIDTAEILTVPAFSTKTAVFSHAQFAVDASGNVITYASNPFAGYNEFVCGNYKFKKVNSADSAYLYGISPSSSAVYYEIQDNTWGYSDKCKYLIYDNGYLYMPSNRTTNNSKLTYSDSVFESQMPGTIKVEVGKSVPADLLIAPLNAVYSNLKIEVDDTYYAVYDKENALIKGLKLGTTEITVSCEDPNGNPLSVTYNIQVVPQKINDIDVPDELFLPVDESYTFDPHVLPVGTGEDNFTYELINNDGVDVRFDNYSYCQIKGYEPGVVYVKVTATDTINNPDYAEPVSKTVKVTFAEYVIDFDLGEVIPVQYWMITDTTCLTAVDEDGTPITFADNPFEEGKTYTITMEGMPFPAMTETETPADEYLVGHTPEGAYLNALDTMGVLVIYEDGKLIVPLEWDEEEIGGVMEFGLSNSYAEFDKTPVFDDFYPDDDHVGRTHFAIRTDITEDGWVMVDGDGNPIEFASNPFEAGEKYIFYREKDQRNEESYTGIAGTNPDGLDFGQYASYFEDTYLLLSDGDDDYKPFVYSDGHIIWLAQSMSYVDSEEDQPYLFLASAKVYEVEVGDVMPGEFIMNPIDGTYESTNISIEDETKLSYDDATDTFTALAAGTVEVTATVVVNDSLTLEKHYTFNISNPAAVEVPLTGIDADDIDNLYVGDTAPIVVTLEPEDTTDSPEFEYASSNEDVATVDEGGVVTAVGPGDATITITDKDNPDITTTITVHVPQPVTEITADAITLTPEETKAIVYSLNPDTAELTDVTFAVTGEAGVITLNDDGTVTGVKGGTTTVTITAINNPDNPDDDVTKTIEVKVIVPVTEIEAEGFTVNVNATKTIEVTIAPNDATDKRVTFESLDPEYATVDGSGVVTGVAPGEADILITSIDNSAVTKTITVKVEKFVENIEADDITVVIGGNKDIDAEFTPEDATTLDDVTYTSDHPEVATVDENGNVVGVAEGEATITIKADQGTEDESDDVIKEVKVTVITPVTEITASDIRVAVNTDKAIDAVAGPEGATNKDLTYESANETIATVDPETGVVTGVAEGSVEITITANQGTDDPSDDYTDTITVTVYVPVTDIDVSEITVPVNETKTLDAEVVPEDATSDELVFTSADETIATVDPETGVVTGVAEGDVEITITATQGTEDPSDDYSETVTVHVIVPVDEINADDMRVVVETEENIGATVNDDATNDDLTYTSSNPDVTVDEEGNIYSDVPGAEADITITATQGTDDPSDDYSETIHVVIINPVTEIDADDMTIEPETTENINATVNPENTTDDTLIYSSDAEDVATVDAEGNVTGHTPGEAHITITATQGTDDPSDDVTATITVTVKVFVEGLYAEDMTINLGDTKVLDVTVSPDDATHPEVTYTLAEEGIVSIDEDGNVTALAVGDVDVTITSVDDPTKTVTVTVTVEKFVSELDADPIVLEAGETETIVLDITPDDATTKDDITYESDNPDVQVDDEGNVTSDVPGATATITVTATQGTDDPSDDVVVEVPVTVIRKPTAIEGKDLVVDLGIPGVIEVIFTPANTTERNLKYTAEDDSVITVDEDGIVTGLKGGETTVLIESLDAEGVTDTITVKVYEIPSVIKADDIEVLVGKTETIVPTFESETANLLDVTYSSSDESIAKVDPETGVVTGIKAGTAEITITSDYDDDVYTTITVTVKQPAESISADPVVLPLDGTDTIDVAFGPDDVSDEYKGLTFETEDDTIVTVDPTTGELTPVGEGETDIIVTAINDPDDPNDDITIKVHVTVEPIKAASISADDIEVALGRTDTIEVTFDPTDTTHKDLVYTSADETVVEVAADGTVTGKQLTDEGVEITITATQGTTDTSDDVTTTIKVKVVPVKADEISADPIEVNVGDTEPIVVKFDPEDTTYTDPEYFTYETSDPTVATVDDEGNVKGEGEGTVEITVTYNNGTPDDPTDDIVITVPVTVVPVDVITISADSFSLDIGETHKIDVEFTPENTTYKDLIFSTEDTDKIEIIDAAEGIVKGIGEGSATISITATNGTPETTDDVTITVDVLVSPVLVDTLEAEGMTISTGEEKEIELTVGPDDATDQTIEFTSDHPEIASVDEDGNVTGNTPGTATIEIRATQGTEDESDDKVITITVTVEQKMVEEIIASDITVKETKTEDIGAVANPDDAYDKTLVYTVEDDTVAAVNADGVVTGIKAGSTTITIRATQGTENEADDVVETIDVTVEIIPVTSITVDPDEIEMLIGDTDIIEPTYGPDDATTTDDVEFSSSDESVVKVDEEGNIIAVGEGEATITITAKNDPDDPTDDVTAEVHIIVKPIPVETLVTDVTADGLVVNQGETELITVTVGPEDATHKEVTFESSDPTIASVDEYGNVTGESQGIITITITANNGTPDDLTDDVTTTVTVIVPHIHTPGEPVHENDIRNDAEETYTFDIVTYCDGKQVDNVTDCDEELNRETVVLDIHKANDPTNTEDGNVEYFTDEDGNKYVWDEEEQKYVETDDVTIPKLANLSAKSMLLAPEETEKVEVEYENIEAPENTVYESADENIFTVDAVGNVTAKAPGRAMLTVRNNSITTTATISVVDTTATVDSYIPEGETKQVEVEVLLEDVTPSEIKFESSNPEAITVDEDGNVSAISEGAAMITVTVTVEEGDLSKEIVKEVPVSTLIDKLTHFDEKEPTEEEDGNYEYWIDEDTGKIYGDEYGIEEIENPDDVIWHYPGEPVHERDFRDDDTDDYYFYLDTYCENCEEEEPTVKVLLDEEKVILVKHPYTEAEEGTDGHTEYFTDGDNNVYLWDGEKFVEGDYEVLHYGSEPVHENDKLLTGEDRIHNDKEYDGYFELNTYCENDNEHDEHLLIDTEPVYLVFVDTVAPHDGEDGELAHYEDDAGNKYEYKDADKDGDKEFVPAGDLVIHNPGEPEQISAVRDDDTDTYKYNFEIHCENDGVLTGEGTVILEKHEKVDATEDADGHEEYFTDVTGQKYEWNPETGKYDKIDSETILHWHIFVWENIDKEPTCVDTGIGDYVEKCAHCDTEFNRTVDAVIPATGIHTPGEAHKENIVEATCTEAGGYDLVVRCTVCEIILSSEHHTENALGHDWIETGRSNEVAPTCTTEGGYDVHYECVRCHITKTEHITVAALGHKDADNDGYCDVCGELMPGKGGTLVMGKGGADIYYISTDKINWKTVTGNNVLNVPGIVYLKLTDRDMNKGYKFVINGNDAVFDEDGIATVVVNGPLVVTAVPVIVPDVEESISIFDKIIAFFKAIVEFFKGLFK